MKPKLLLLLLLLTACQQHVPIAATRALHTPSPTTTPTPGPSPTPDTLHVYVTGAVNTPLQVHELPMDATLQDAINAAGGLAPNANVANLNLARILEDNEHVHVPRVADATPTPGSPTPAPDNPTPQPSGDKINVNTATATELDTLPGIGPSTAQAIIAHREQHGPFQSVDDLLAVRGIGEKKLDAIRDLVATQ
jgi:competence protein ComEA